MLVGVYMLRCREGSYYIGSHRGEDVGTRVAQHQDGIGGDYTNRRRPVELVWSDTIYWATDAIACERKLKGWSRPKKEALIRSDWAAISALSKRRGGRVRPSRPPSAAPQDEDLCKAHPSSSS
jgi:putative endonuclease